MKKYTILNSINLYFKRLTQLIKVNNYSKKALIKNQINLYYMIISLVLTY